MSSPLSSLYLKRKTLHLSLLFLLVGLTTILAACGSTSNSAQASSSTGSNSANACNKSTGLTLYSAQGYDSAAAKAFQQQTGIKVNLIDDSTGNLIAKVAAERNNPQWDVIWFDGNVTMQSLDDQGYLLKNWSSSAINNYNTLGSSNIPSDHAYYPTGITAPGVIAYNTKHIPASGLPTDWSDLTKPAYKNMLAMSDPAYSGPAYPFMAGLAQVMGGENQAQTYFTQLKANGLKVFQTNGPTLNSVETGAREFAIAQDSAVYAAIAAGQPLGIIYPSSGVAAMPSDIGIAANAPHMACAQQFVNWVLSANGGQKVMSTDLSAGGDAYFKPLINGVTPDAKRNDSSAKFITLNVTQWANAENEFKQWFHNNIVQ
jgi:iron(III) transport system substrate-binding protein